jgi:hypothetical protein
MLYFEVEKGLDTTQHTKDFKQDRFFFIDFFLLQSNVIFKTYNSFFKY